jgi:hypothetical protein
MPIYRKDAESVDRTAASLADLILGNQVNKEQSQLAAMLKGEAAAKNRQDAEDFAKAQGMKPGKFSMNVSDSGYSVNPEQDLLANQLLQNSKALRAANITGYDIADPLNVVPTVKDAEEVKKSTGALKAVQSKGTNLQEKLNDTNLLDRFGSVRIPFTDKQIGTSKGIGIDSDIADISMELKDLYNLGAITGPDQAIIEKALGSVSGIGAMIGGKERAISQLTEVLNRARAKVETGALSRGYKPKPNYLDAPQTKTPKMSFEEWKKAKAEGRL